jgi:tetratricopeptide (TPR) repeat protein
VTPTPTNTPGPTRTYNFTPLPRATTSSPVQCPAIDAPEPLNFESAGSIGEEELEQIRIFLSDGGSVEQVRLGLTAVRREGILRQQDLTRDGVPEVILLQPFLDVLGCAGDSYQRLLRVYPEDPNIPVLRSTITDLNGNAVPELVVETEFWGVHDYTLNVSVYEWDGEEFVNRMPSQLDHPLLEHGWLYWERGRALMYNGELVLGDVDINGTIELVLQGGEIGGMEAMMSAPQLSQQHVWMWNGREFTLVDVTFSEPELKFHAAQIGDLYSLMGKYDDAIAFYQQAIFDTELIAWNVEWMELAMMGAGLEPGQMWPTQDYEQGQRINAYARFRMLLIHTLLGDDYALETQYATIEELREEDNAGYWYANLASEFRQAYLEEGESITAGCQAAQDFTEQHKSAILGTLSSGIYGAASWDYEVDDICPFKDEDRAA